MGENPFDSIASGFKQHSPAIFVVLITVDAIQVTFMSYTKTGTEMLFALLHGYLLPAATCATACAISFAAAAATSDAGVNAACSYRLHGMVSRFALADRRLHRSQRSHQAFQQ
jgi:hypothetical protein